MTIAYFRQIVNKLNTTRNRLILANILLVFFLILLSNLGILPFKGIGDFGFFIILALVMALYRPSWGFLFFIGTVALENINLAPQEFGIIIRPYQLFGGLTILALITRWGSKRLNFKLLKLNWRDYLVIAIAMLGFISAFFAEDKGVSLKLAVILSSFIFLYFLARIYVQSVVDVKKIAPFFLSSGIIVIFYGIWQNIRFGKGLESFETMPGRPNSTFTEADWLGIFLVLLLVIIYVLMYSLREKYAAVNSEILIDRQIAKKIFLYVYLILIFTLLIITVSRSAWLGALSITFVFLLVVLTGMSYNFRKWRWRIFGNKMLIILVTFSITLVYVKSFNLTDFELISRAQSTGTGLQKITIACKKPNLEVGLPSSVSDVSELEEYNCWHINLEDIEKEKQSGYFVAEIYRDDPNVNIRSKIYRTSWMEIKKHPILGIGWGSISDILGNDERGVGLNSSNIFLQVWLGSGILGLLAFAIIWLYILFESIRKFLKEDKVVGVLMLLGALAIIIPNMFNAGLLLGFIWVYLGASISLLDENRNRH